MPAQNRERALLGLKKWRGICVPRAIITSGVNLRSQRAMQIEEPGDRAQERGRRADLRPRGPVG